ncbi:MAG: chitobiase/beta-hexosaminidase C-terminal domain-containing protein [Bacteroidales bacterium]|nr:chitobiase/beta-hexosaminidase C-terminal domain-containing protein [Bacteroidales bacterium]
MIYVLFLSTTIAQETKIINDSIFSNVLNEKRQIKILVPEENESCCDTKYDVVYIIDGETHFEDFSFLYSFARHEKLVPPLLLVSIPNIYINRRNMRDRDFLPEKTIDNKIAGGADNFIAFLKNELIPYIDKNMPASGNNSLFGHSLGGLFVMYVLLKDPAMFSNYYCSDPAFPWNNNRILTMTTEVFKNTAELNNTLWITGTEATYRNVGIGKMDSILKELTPEGLLHKVSVYPDETHMSVRLKGIYDGLKYSYNGYNSKKEVEFHPMNGSLLNGKPAQIFLNGNFPNVYYTTDGTEPDTTSKRAPQMIEITGPARLTLKWIGDNKKYITKTQGNFELCEVWPALKNAKDIQKGGLRFSYYEGKWKELPDFTKLKAVKTGIADSSFIFRNLPSESNFGCVFEGFLKIDEEGYYLFALSSSDGSKFFINDLEIINNDGLHGNEWYKSYVVPLQEGFYPVRFEYFQAEGNRQFNFVYLKPNQHETVNLNFNMMYFKKSVK